MIGRDEIEAKATELGIHTSNVQRDYVFGWLVGGLHLQSALRDTLVLKGGNALRKAYFPATRYSDDLDFTTTEGLDDALLVREFNDVCRLVSDRTGVRFDLSRNAIVDEQLIDRERRVYKMRLYFNTSTKRSRASERDTTRCGVRGSSRSSSCRSSRAIASCQPEH